jgi:amino acid transporter
LNNTPVSGKRESSRTFAVTAVIAIAITAITVPLGLLDWVPFVGDLLAEQHAAGTIAALILAVALWVVLYAYARVARGTQERAALQWARLNLGPDMSPELLDQAPHPDSLVVRRLRTLVPGAPGAVLAARSELDHAHSDVSYGPARALVWALPALGFLGTATEMSVAVRGLSASVAGSGGYAGLRDALVSKVIPPLGDAFGVTLFALAASVVCHLLLTWTNSREQRILLELEEVTLETTALYGPAEATPVNLTSLNNGVNRLASEINLARDAMTTSSSRMSDLGQMSGLLQSVDQRLAEIRAELARDFVLSRMRQPTGELT